MEEILKYLPFIIPIAVLQLSLQVFALIHLIKHKNCKVLSMPVWIIIIVIGQFLGGILYFTIGRSDSIDDSED